MGTEHRLGRIAAFGRCTILLGAILLAVLLVYFRIGSHLCLADECLWCRFAFIGIGVALIGRGGSSVAVAASPMDYEYLTANPVVSYSNPMTKPLPAARIIVVPSGTRAVLLRVSRGMREVRILEGPHAGQKGFVKPAQVEPRR